ncbi:P-II family nitrogen regulator [Xanthobacter sp. V2C-8]|uniref:P-II family nitrogen regulator n=1 Tax=Xanthobacter albus TaxID=3119929 RepID=UPI00372B64BD
MSIENAASEGLRLLTALIHPNLEEKVVRALQERAEFPGFTIVEARGQGRGRGVGGTYVASEYDLVYQRHLRLEIVCHAHEVEAVSAVIAAAGWTGRRGDGVVFVTPVEGFVRIREAGAPAECTEAAR